VDLAAVDGVLEGGGHALEVLAVGFEGLSAVTLAPCFLEQ
jgi:hypothetical protein